MDPVEHALRARNERLQRRIDLLESLIEDRSREVFVANEQLQAAMAFLRDVYTAMPDGLFVFNRAGTVEAVNPAALALLGGTEEEVVGQPIHHWVVTPDGLTMAAVELAVARSGALRVEGVLRPADGRPMPVLISATTTGTSVPAPVWRSDEVETRRVVCVVMDVRVRAEAEFQSRQAQKLAAVGRLAAGVSHEINSPAQFVSDSCHFVRDGLGDVLELLVQYRRFRLAVASGTVSPGTVDAIAAAEEAIDLEYLLAELPVALDRALDGLGRITSIVRSMKAFAHPGQREMVAVDLNEEIRGTLTIARNEYKYVADLETDFGDLPPVVCHPGEVNQVVLNLVLNAAHAIEAVVRSTDGRGRISVRTRAVGDAVMVTVADTGAGMPSEIRERIFEPFFTTKEVGRGTGQGLAIARSVVVDRHGGQFTFDSEVGRGTTFIILLPAAGPPGRERPSP